MAVCSPRSNLGHGDHGCGNQCSGSDAVWRGNPQGAIEGGPGPSQGQVSWLLTRQNPSLPPLRAKPPASIARTMRGIHVAWRASAPFPGRPGRPSFPSLPPLRDLGSRPGRVSRPLPWPPSETLTMPALGGHPLGRGHQTWGISLGLRCQLALNSNPPLPRAIQ